MQKQKQRTDERGIALLMTLGILSLLLILAMAFSFSARTERMLSENNAEALRARLLAQSTLNRVIALMDYNFDPANPPAGTPPTNWHMYPGTSGKGFVDAPPDASAPTLGHQHYLWYSSYDTDNDQVGYTDAVFYKCGIGAATDTKGYLPKLASAPAGKGWMHYKAPEAWNDADNDNTVDDGELRHSGTTVENVLVARSAFVVVDETGKIDPNGAVNITGDLTWETAAPADADVTKYYDIDRDEVFDTSQFTEAAAAGINRVQGLTPQEIDVNAFFANLAYTNLPLVPGGGRARWFSWFHMTHRPAFSTSPAAWTNPHYATSTLFPSAVADEEKYYDSTVVAPASPYKDKVDIWNLPATGWPGVSELTTIQHFIDMPQKFQFAANLIDFTDTDNEATVLDSSGNPVTPIITSAATVADNASIAFVGLEKASYINEVAFNFSYNYDDNATPPDKTDDSGALSIEPKLELYNLYGADANTYTAHCVLSGTVTLNAGDPAVAWNVAGATDHFVFTSSVAIAKNSASSLIPSSPASRLIYTVTGATTPHTLQSVTITECDVYLLNSSGELVDFAHIISSGTPQTSSGLPGTGFAYQGVALSHDTDPRCNTTTSGWVARPISGVGYGQLDNPTALPTASDDKVPTGFAINDPNNALDAYIADKPNVTFWELGAVHRGEPWRTLNLHKYDLAQSSGSYERGDFELIERLKLGGFDTVLGRVNANSPIPGVWERVLYGMEVGSTDYFDTASPTVLGGSPTPPPLAALAAAISAYVKATPIKNVAELVNIPEVIDPSLYAGVSTTDNDQQQEEVIGKLYNLLSVRHNVFTVLVTAQTMKDLRTVNAPNSILYDGTNYATIRSEERILATIHRDAFTREITILRTEQLEE